MGNTGDIGSERWWGRALALAIAVVVADPVAGQEATPPRANRLIIDATVESLYDSDVLRGNGLPGANAGAHQDDFRVSPSLSASYQRNSGRLALAANALVGYDFFRYNKYLNNNRFAGGGSITYHSGSSCQIDLDGNVSSRQDGIRTNGAPIVDPAGVPADNVGAVINNVETAATYGTNFGCFIHNHQMFTIFKYLISIIY